MNHHPLPANPAHQRLADLHLAGRTLTEAAKEIGLGQKGKSPSTLASRIWKRADVQAYVASIRQTAADGAVLTMREKREFLARIVRSGIHQLDPSGNNADLIAEHSTHESEMGSSFRIKKLDPLKAIEIDNKLTGEDSETLALKEIADALASLGSSSPIPTDKL